MIDNLFGSSEGVDPASQLAFQVRSLILVNNALFGQLVDHGGYFRQLFASFLLPLDLSQVTDRITGGFAIVAITIPALGGLPYIFLVAL